MTNARRKQSNRRGSVYLAVLGTALIVSLLAFSALALQRVQNRMLSASVDVRQAQLNAEAAIELGLLAIKNDPNWRTTYSNGTWFSNRSTGEGGCTLTVTDPIDANLADSATEAIVMTGVGSAGKAVQQVVRTIDSYAEPLGCLRSSVAAGGAISLSGSSVLRATNSGLISANSSSVSGSTVYGKVEAVTVSGSTYSGTTSQIAAADRPAMPDWSTVFNDYRTNGTEININNLPTSTPNFGRNVGFETGPVTPVTDWTGTPTGVPTATIAQSTNQARSGTYSLRVSSRADWWAGAAQYIDGYVKPGQQYTIEAWVYVTGALPGSYYFTLYTKGTGGSVNTDGGGTTAVIPGVWTPLSGTLTAPSWSGSLEYAFVKIAASSSVSGTPVIYVDDFAIRETTTGRFIFRQVLGPNVNPFGTSDPNGRYWINCGGNKLIIERSRIKGTLLVVNPGSGSCIGPGPIHWSPATPGYPALLVDADTATSADFTIAATNRSLSEADDGVNYNPTFVSHDSLGEDGDVIDSYPSEIQGLVVVEDDVTFQNNSLVRGAVIAGDAVTATSGALEVVFRPDALLSPPPGFTGTPSQAGRPLSIRKAVVP